MNKVVTIRQATPADCDFYLELQRESWGDDLAVEEDKARKRFELCLEGILIAMYDGEPVGTTTMIRLPGYDFGHPLTWDEATGNGWCNTHTPDGTICFGVDLSVAKGGGFAVVDALMVGCMQLVIRWGVKYCILGGRMPAYHRHVEEYPDPAIYMRTRRGRRYIDPQVQMYSKVPGLKMMSLIPDYFDDPDSLNNGVLWRWHNPFFGLPGRKLWAGLVRVMYRRWQAVEQYQVQNKLKKSAVA